MPDDGGHSSVSLTFTDPLQLGDRLLTGTTLSSDRVAQLLNAEFEALAENRTVFVGYPYSIPMDDYRGVFERVGKEHDVVFVFADQELTNKHILEKITTMMRAAAFSLFDITHWNPNVALELGIAYGLNLDYYILFDPTKEKKDVLSDVRGIDRIQYESYNQLEGHLSKLMRSQFGAPDSEQHGEAGSLMAQLESLAARIPEVLAAEPGLLIGGIASSLDVSIEVAQALVKPLVGSEIETRGVRRGMRYYRMGEAPPEEPPEEVDERDDATPQPKPE